MIGQIAEIWENGDDEDRQAVAQSLFTEVVYNLDTWSIESLRLKPWAERFVTVRMALYAEENGDLDGSAEGVAEGASDGEI